MITQSGNTFKKDVLLDSSFFVFIRSIFWHHIFVLFPFPLGSLSSRLQRSILVTDLLQAIFQGGKYINSSTFFLILLIPLELCWGTLKQRLAKAMAGVKREELDDLEFADLLRVVVDDYAARTDGSRIAGACKKRMLRVMKGTIV